MDTPTANSVAFRSGGFPASAEPRLSRGEVLDKAKAGTRTQNS